MSGGNNPIDTRIRGGSWVRIPWNGVLATVRVLKVHTLLARVQVSGEAGTLVAMDEMEYVCQDPNPRD